MAIYQRFSTIRPGAISITGNTLGLSKNAVLAPGTNPSIGAFITTNTALATPAAWAGVVNLAKGENVTLNWQDNSSKAFLTYLPGSTVLYAELIWGGLSNSYGVDVSASLNNPVNFTTPLGTYSVTPTSATAQSFFISAQETAYTRSADVTALVAAAGPGAYITGAVPSALAPANQISNGAGWSLIVAFENAALPIRQLSIYSQGVLVQASSQVVNLGTSGFLTPSSGPVDARILLSALDGDATVTGDIVQFGPDILSLTKLYGPNNLANPPNNVDNFFGSQINFGDSTSSNVGALDTTGTFGTLDQHLNTATNIVAGRQSWDITNVDASGAMTNSQSTGVLAFSSTGDNYVLNGLGIQIDVAAPVVDIQKIVDKEQVAIGDTLTYTLIATNNGNAPTSNFDFVDYLPTGVILNTSSINVVGATGTIVNNSTSTALNVEVGPLTVNQSIAVQFQVTASISTADTIVNSATGYYCYDPSVGLCGFGVSTLVSTTITVPSINGTLWYDLNCDGLKVATEPLASGIVMELYAANNLTMPIAITTTDSVGNYSFTTVPTGSYYVKAIAPNGYSYTLSNVVNNPTITSQLDKNTGFSQEIILNTNNTTTIANGGFCIGGCISGQAFFDCNSNSIFDGGEALLCDVLITLIDSNGIEINSVKTNCDGYYQFCNLSSGTYSINVQNPTEMTFVSQNSSNFYGSKANSLGIFTVTLANSDYNEGFVGFTGSLTQTLKYCFNNNEYCTLGCGSEDSSSQNKSKETNNNCIGCNSCRSNKNITTSRVSCNNCNCNKKSTNSNCSSCNSCGSS